MIKDILFVLIVLSMTLFAHTNKSEIIEYIYEGDIKAESAFIS